MEDHVKGIAKNLGTAVMENCLHWPAEKAYLNFTMHVSFFSCPLRDCCVLSGHRQDAYASLPPTPCSFKMAVPMAFTTSVASRTSKGTGLLALLAAGFALTG